jgi:hypothetical protein
MIMAFFLLSPGFVRQSPRLFFEENPGAVQPAGHLLVGVYLGTVPAFLFLTASSFLAGWPSSGWGLFTRFVFISCSCRLTLSFKARSLTRSPGAASSLIRSARARDQAAKAPDVEYFRNHSKKTASQPPVFKDLFAVGFVFSLF